MASVATTTLRRLLPLFFAFLFIAHIAAAQTPSPALLVVHRGIGGFLVHDSDHFMAIVDPRTNKVVGRVPINGHPHLVVVSDDGKFAYVSCSAYGIDRQQTPDDTITVVDL